MSILEIYTDGSSAPKPRIGGAGFRIIFPDGTTKDFSPWGYKGGTNNEMELQACVLALREVVKLEDLGGSESIIIYSDANYVVKHIYQAKFVWPKRNWTTESGGPVLSTPIWKDLIRLILRVYRKFHCNVYFEKVKGHSGDQGNEAAHKLAGKSRTTPFSNKLSYTNVRRKLTTEKIVVGSIKGEGQKVRIRVITSRWLNNHKIYRCAVEVLSKTSKYYKKADYALTDQVLRGGHVFDIRLADNLEVLKIEKVFKEIKKK